MKVIIIDIGLYDLEKLKSICIAGEADVIISKAESMICGADKIIFPVSGDPITALRKLQITNLSNLIKIIKKPFLGIEVGMQLLCSEIKGKNLSGMSIFNVGSECIIDEDKNIPMSINSSSNDPLFKDLVGVHDFVGDVAFKIPINNFTIAYSEYQGNISAAIRKNNFWGVMFKPELFGEAGKVLLNNFIHYC